MAGLVEKLTLGEKAALCVGDSFWAMRGIERLGVPSIVLTDGPHGVRRQQALDDAGLGGSRPATCFPTGSALAATWDVALLEEVGTALGREARAQGVSVLLGPGANLKRTPLCGRNFEYFSEDPLLSGEIAGAWIRGVQSQGVAASLKHFAPTAKIGEVHGRVVAGPPDLFPLYHPAAAMYNQTLKATLFEDARALHAELVQRAL